MADDPNRQPLATSKLPKLVSIPAGCFVMGSPEPQPGRNDHERAHRVCVTAFALGRYEVTVGEFRRFIQASGYQTEAELPNHEVPTCQAMDLSQHRRRWDWQAWANWQEPTKGQPARDDHPVACVSWKDAQAYLAWLNRTTSGGYRLPTEAEWEYAARAGTQTARFWGDWPEEACDYANVADQTALPDGTHWRSKHDCTDGAAFAAPVGQYRPNAWGLHDLLGNVREWTCSAWDPAYAGGERRCAAADENDPRTIRGGSWDDDPRWVRSATRESRFRDFSGSYLGFRVARD